jgi:hypothetical protein
LLLKDAAAVAAAAAAAHPLATKEPAATNVVTPPVVVVETKTNEVPAVVVVPAATNVGITPATNEVVGVTNPPVVAVVDTNVPAATNVAAPVAPMLNATGSDTNPPPTPPIELVKRVITREGLLKGSFSIQAPSHFELRSLDNNRLIDYVWSPSTNIVSTLKNLKGKKVLVTGEELLDERWPHTPVITAEEVVLAP